MTTPTNDERLEDAVLDAATGPAEARDAAGSFTAHDPEKLQRLRDRLNADSSAAKNHLGLRFIRLQSPGAG